MTEPRIFTIPPSAPFLPTLANAIVSGELVAGFRPREDPLALAGATVFLPTRRAARAFADALLDALGREATLLPRIVPLGEVDADEPLFTGEAARDLPPAIGTTRRRLALAGLIHDFSRRLPQTIGAEFQPVMATPAAALTLADELARLFDDLAIAEVPFERLERLAPDHLDSYWKISQVFLAHAAREWASFLERSGLVDREVHRAQLLAHEAERMARRDGGPYIVAGSTGTIPAVANLIAAIAARPDGAVILPGLDQALDEESFRLIGGGTYEGAEIEASPGHPQFGLMRLIARLGIERGHVRSLGAAPSGRVRLISEAFRPAATTERWKRRGELIPDEEAIAALATVTVVEAAEPREEALAIATGLRKILEQPHKQAALVTPDRALARRVSAELRRWNIEVDDSAGLGLADTEAGRLACLAVNAAAEGLAPVPLLALLRHPLTKLGMPESAVDRLEIAVLRGPRPAPGAAGLQRAIGEMQELAQRGELHRRDARANWHDDWALAAGLAQRIGEALHPLLTVAAADAMPLATLLRAHRDALAALGVELAAEGAEIRPDVRALAQAFDEFERAGEAPRMRLSDYADSLTRLLAAEPPVRPTLDAHARIRILGPLEARLLHFDRIFLGGLNEGTWPPQTHADAWLNRPMRRELGLDLPERRIGLSAHDFVQAMGAEEIVLTRAKKQGGVATVAARFLQRLAAAAPEKAWNDARARGDAILDYVRAWERPSEEIRIQRPAPTPPVSARPVRFSVTDIETLRRDPYSIYARDVLGLAPLDSIDADPGAAERGTILHAALAEFLKAHPKELPADAFQRLIECGRQAFAEIEDFPGIKAIWWPRFERVARWFVEQEEARRRDIAQSLAETSGAIEITCGDRTFRLSARADRIDIRKDGSIAILDYKTGQPPGINEVVSGLAPQLPLEAAIARGGGFATVKANSHIAEIAIVRLTGGTPPGIVRVLDPTKATGKTKEHAERHGIADANSLADFSREMLQTLFAKYNDANAPYQSIPRPKWRGRFGRYDHLARIKEWSAGGAEDQE